MKTRNPDRPEPPPRHKDPRLTTEKAAGRRRKTIELDPRKIVWAVFWPLGGALTGAAVFGLLRFMFEEPIFLACALLAAACFAIAMTWGEG